MTKPPMTKWGAALLLLALPAPLAARETPARTAADAGMVSAADPRAAAAGVEMLRAGGSAADAAIATALALNVVEPQSSGIGGGGFAMFHDAGRDRTSSFDGREEAPHAADGRWFYATDGTPMTHAAAVPGGRSVGVPGNLRMWAALHRAEGKLPWARLFAPAIRLARKGFVLQPRLHGLLLSDAGHVDAGARAIFFGADGQPKPVGTVLHNPEQAALLEQIAKRGADYFYVGPPARTLVATVNGAARNASKMAAGDLASYDAKERAPLCAPYRTYRVCSMAPPSSGGITVLLILKQLERFDMAKLGRQSPVAWHLFAESSRLAYADRDLYVGDPGYVSVPLTGLLDPAYIARRSALIAPDRTMATIAAGMPAGAPPRQRAVPAEVPGTTHMVAVDRKGDVASITSTIEGVFGSGLTMQGVFLNNELTDFDIVPDKDGLLVANRVEPGKRPRSSMAPTIVYDQAGKVRVAIGAAGGPTIIAQVAKALVGVLDWGMTAQDAIAMGLLFAPGATGVVERGTATADLVPQMLALGERLTVAPLGVKANAIERVNGRWVGAADPRSEGVAMAEDGSVAPITRVGRAPGAPNE